MVKCILIEDRQSVLEVMHKYFATSKLVEIFNGTMRECIQHYALDALVMDGQFAHERYGGSPKKGVAHILRTTDHIPFPRWVITMPPLHMIQASSGFSVIYRTDKKSTLEEDGYVKFDIICKEIIAFNIAYPDARIERIGIDCEISYFPVSNNPEEIIKEIQGMRQALEDNFLLAGTE